MIETTITIVLNRKSDFEIVKEKIIESNFHFPVYIFESENSYKIEFVSDYEEWELDNKILLCFPDFEFTKDLEKGLKEIRIQLTRSQSEFSTDGWGRPIENPIKETKYLIKKSTDPTEKYYPNIKILFGENEQNYFINIVSGINKYNNEKGYLLLNDFKTRNKNKETEVLKDKLYKTLNEAFLFGYYKLQELVNQDFSIHIKNEKKKTTELYKVPRKIIRNFISSCNKFETNEILKLLDENIVFEKLFKMQTIIKTEGIQKFEEYLNSSAQDLCLMNFKIKSSWAMSLPYIEIEVKFYPKKSLNEEEKIFLKFRKFKFKLKNSKIISIIEER